VLHTLEKKRSKQIDIRAKEEVTLSLFADDKVYILKTIKTPAEYSEF
jgi:hypothetical protein